MEVGIVNLTRSWNPICDDRSSGNTSLSAIGKQPVGTRYGGTSTADALSLVRAAAVINRSSFSKHLLRIEKVIEP